jgi:hypothetical protein
VPETKEMHIKYIITNNQYPSRRTSPTSVNGSKALELPVLMDQGHLSNQEKRARNSTVSGRVEKELNYRSR